MKAELSWSKDMQFHCNNHGILTTIDATNEHGGLEAGPTPKELVLNAMMGCTAMDVVTMLKKMRQEIVEFKMEIEAEKTIEHPIHFKTACLMFYLKGNIEKEKLIKAVDASLSKYCGVNYMISKSCQITFKIFLSDQLIKEGPVVFILENSK